MNKPGFLLTVFHRYWGWRHSRSCWCLYWLWRLVLTQCHRLLLCSRGLLWQILWDWSKQWRHCDCDCDLEIINEKPERLEILDFKHKEAQGNFKNLTSDTKDFTNCFSTKNVPLIKQVENWRRILKAYCNKSFKKIRIKKMKLNL